MKPIIFSDFDGTITQVDVTDLVLARLAHPSWQEVEQEWARGVIGSRECLERQMALVNVSREEFSALIDSVAVDSDFEHFYQFTRRRKLPFYVVSDGFDIIIRRVLRNCGLDGPLRNGAHFFSSTLKVRGRRMEPAFPYSGPPCEHDCATCKVEILRRRGQNRWPVIFIGDGLSDRFAAEAADIVFAKRQLLAYCRENGIACRPFETFGEIEAGLEVILDKSAEELMLTERWQKKKDRNLKMAVAVGN